MSREHPLAQLPEDWQETLLSNYKEGASDTEIRAELGVTYAKWRQLRDDSPDFDKTVIIGQQMAKAWWMRVGRLNIFDNKFNSFLWYRNMQNRFGWSDKQTSNVDGPVSKDEDLYDEDTVNDRLEDLIKEHGTH